MPHAIIGPATVPAAMRCRANRMGLVVLALVNRGLVGCQAPDEKMDRYYRTTDTGKKVGGIIEAKGK